MIVDKINQFLSTQAKTIDQAIVEDVGKLCQYAFTRQFLARDEDNSPSLRLSSIGRCIRASAYRLLGFEENGKQIDSRARIVFFMGDLVEIAITQLAKAAGCEISATGDQQSSVEIDGVVGHPDGLLRDSGKTYLLEVKSMSSFSFKDFERGVIDDGYRFQVNAYLEAMGLNECVIVALNKDAGVLHEQMILKDPAIVADIRSRIKTLRAATKENLPPRPFQPNDKGFYPWNCLYCAFHGTCLPNSEKVVVSGKYKLKERTKNEATPKSDKLRAGSAV